MIPGLPPEMMAGSDEESSKRIKRMICITDSMSSKELDGDGTCFYNTGKDGKPTDITWRVKRLAKGSGTSVREVEELLCQYRMMANMAKQAGGKHGWLQGIQKLQQAAGGKGRGPNGMPTPAQIQAAQVREKSISNIFNSVPMKIFAGVVRGRCHQVCSNRCNAR